LDCDVGLDTPSRTPSAIKAIKVRAGGCCSSQAFVVPL